MPYRRLPKTDQARLRALQRAIQQAGNKKEIKKIKIQTCVSLGPKTSN